MPAPPFEKTCPCIILAPPFFNFSDSSSWETIKIHSAPLKKEGVRTMRPKSQDKNFDISRTKRCLLGKIKSFFIIFKGYPVAKSCLRLENVSLNQLRHCLIGHIRVLRFFLIYKVVHNSNDFWNLFLDKVYLKNKL